MEKTTVESPQILLLTDELVAVDKPEGLATIPERTERERCLVNILRRSLETKLFVVHRLDKDVSGVVVFARTAESHRNLCLQFERRESRKMYSALVLGIPLENQGTVNTPIRRFGSGRMGVDTARGKPCLTEFAVQEQFPGHSLLTVRPLTGRRHQIRVHLYSIGHPVAGDRYYGDREVQRRYPRLMLHASRLELRLLSGRELCLESPLPPSFLAVLNDVRSGNYSPNTPQTLRSTSVS